MISNADPERRYSSYVHFSFSIIETLWGIWSTPPVDVVVVEYSVPGIGPTRAQAIEQAKKWIDSRRDEWWNKQEAIIFLEDLRFVNWGEIPEISTGPHYRFAGGVGSCKDNFHSSSTCPYWRIGDDNSFGTWVWLPFVGQDASLEVPDSERMFHVVVVPYGANTKEHRIAPASLANIKAILERFQKAHWSDINVRATYINRLRDLWKAKGSDSYWYVYSGVDDEGHSLFPTQRIVVRNGEAVEAFYAEDYEEGGVVYPAGTEIEFRNTPSRIEIPTLERSSSLWSFVHDWLRHPDVFEVSFDYEFGYPTAIRWRFKNEPDLFFYASDYTPLDN